MAITLRAVTGSALTHNQVDTNFASLIYSASVSGSNLEIHYTGSSVLGVLPRSSSLNLPLGSKWTDTVGGGITRNSNVLVTGSLTVTGSTVLRGSINQGATTNQAIGFRSIATGLDTVASGSYSFVQGRETIASGSHSHAEGYRANASGSFSHAEGSSTIASGNSSHAEGVSTVASGASAHAEGNTTTATGPASHAEGYLTIAIGEGSHAEGENTQAVGNYSHAEGLETIASGNHQHVQGQYNISSSAQSAFIIGNGTTDNNRSNLVFASGSRFEITGSLIVSGAISTNQLNNSNTDGLVISGNTNITLREANANIENGVIIGTTSLNNSPYTDRTTNFVLLRRGWSAISGSSNLTTNALHVSNSINYVSSSGDNIARGLFINPTLTGVSDYRAIQTTTGSVIFNGNTTITGSLNVTGGFVLNGNTQFNHGMFFHTASQTIGNGTSGSALLSTTAVANGVSITGESRITVDNPGYYNIQFSAQLAQGAGGAIQNIWFKKNGVNILNSNSKKTLQNNTKLIMTVDITDYATNTGDYYEITHQSDANNSSLEYVAASGNIPGTPSIIVTVQQVR